MLTEKREMEKEENIGGRKRDEERVQQEAYQTLEVKSGTETDNLKRGKKDQISDKKENKGNIKKIEEISRHHRTQTEEREEQSNFP